MNLTATQLTKLTIDAYADLTFEQPTGLRWQALLRRTPAPTPEDEHTVEPSGLCTQLSPFVDPKLSRVSNSEGASAAS